MSALRDHPRVCGEHWRLNVICTTELGSSPRMRGTPNDGPANAPADGDHPRVCGEHRMLAAVLAVLEGSSPRMRGTLFGRQPPRLNRGIIPAYAGNTSTSCRVTGFRRDHPRVCGEHVVSDVLFAVDSGSSPRMRGTPALATSSTSTVGIIPAYAGNTS